MKKSTLVLISLAMLGLGLLVGYSLVDEEQDIDTGGQAAVPAAASTDGAPVFRYLSPEDIPEDWQSGDSGPAFSTGENFVAYDTPWRSQTLNIALAADSRVEYKIIMAQGDAVFFTWSVDGEEVYHDFHAHDTAFGEEFFTRYEDGYASERTGMIVAAYSGQHGWYWQNLEPDAATITLEVAGVYEKIVEIDLQ